MSSAEDLRQRLVRNVHEIELHGFDRAPLYNCQSGSLTDGTAAQQLGAGFDIVPPGFQSCPYHFHWAQEEMFIILVGSGTLRVAGERVPIKAGDVITIPAGPEYPHHILNTGDVDLHYISISTMQRPEVCEYPDSGKVGAFPGKRGERFVQQRANHLDYWEGEP